MTDFAAVRSENSLIDIISRYVELKRRGKEYVGLCPFHDDSKPSLTVYPCSDGNYRYRCFACGAGSEGGDVIDFICAIKNCDAPAAAAMLSRHEIPDIGAYQAPAPQPDQSIAWKPIVPAPDDAPKYNPAKTFNPHRGKIVHYRPTRIDTYRNEQGQVLCHVVRLDFDDGAKACITVTFCSGPDGQFEWTAKRMAAPFPLMNLDGLAARKDDCVLVVSGEKCQEIANERMKKFVVTTWLGGDGTVADIDFSPLKNRYVCYWPDADASSIRSMIEMQNRIERNGTG